MQLESIRELVEEDIHLTNAFIVSSLESSIPLIKEILDYVLSCGGKRIRPIVLLLSRKAVNYAGKHHIALSAVIELIHTATLLHDDVVDSSTLRRGHKTAHTIWGSEASVLVGDFLYSRAFQIVVELELTRVLSIFAKATPLIAEGEILQLANCRNLTVTEKYYFDVIERKTAKLFEVAAELGAVIGTENEAWINALRDYGKHLGFSYQLIDDALDYSKESEQTGKNIGQDIAEGKTTLPLIYAMQHCNPKQLKILENAITKNATHNIQEILNIIESTGAILYTQTQAKWHANAAKQSLREIPDSVYKNALIALADFVVSREY